MIVDIRQAREADMAAILRMGREFHDQSSFAGMAEYDAGSFERTVGLLMSEHVAGVLLIANYDGAVVGMAGCALFPFFFNVNVTLAQELFWYVQPEHRKGAGAALLDGLEIEAGRRGAVAMISAAIAGLRDDAIARVYVRRGYEPAENTFIKRLQQQ